MPLVQEFREFAVKGNVVDMAVGILVGVAFNKVVNSLVNDVLMPPIGLAVGGVEFKHLEVVLRAAETTATGETLPAVAIHYGAFVNTLVEFAIVALSAFVVVQVMNRVIRARETWRGDR